MPANVTTASFTVSDVTRHSSTVSKPCLLSHSICSILVKSSTPASPSCALTRVKAKKWTLRFAVISLFSWRTEPEQRLRGFLYRASTSSIPALIFSKSEYLITASPRRIRSPANGMESGIFLNTLALFVIISPTSPLPLVAAWKSFPSR